VDDDPTPEGEAWHIGWTSRGDWWRYTFEVPTAGWVKAVVRAATPGPGTLRFYWDEDLVGSVVCQTPGWGEYRDFALPEAFWSASGPHTLRLVQETGGVNLDLMGLGFDWDPPTRRMTFQEDFDSYRDLGEVRALGGWTVEHGPGAHGGDWALGDARLETQPFSLGGMDGGFMVADPALDRDARIDTSLISPPIDCRGLRSVSLEFNHHLAINAASPTAQHFDLDLDTFDEASGRRREQWINLFHRERGDASLDARESVALSPHATDRRIRLRWRFHRAAWDHYWALDKVTISATADTALAPPTLEAFAINAGATSTTHRRIRLEPIARGHPAQFMASESGDFAGARWETYTPHLAHWLSAAPGLKEVYLRVRNAAGVSAPRVQAIQFTPAPPVLAARRSFTTPYASTPGTCEVTVEVDHDRSAALAALELEETPPRGWTFHSVASGPAPTLPPFVGQPGPLRFRWPLPPGAPFTFAYRIQAVDEEARPGAFEGRIRVRGVGAEQSAPVTGPDRLAEVRPLGTTLQRALWGATVLSDQNWDWVARAGFTLAQSYGSDIHGILHNLDTAGARGLRVIPGHLPGSGVPWLTLRLESAASGAPESLRVDCVHYFRAAHPSLLLRAPTGHPLESHEINLLDPAVDTVEELVSYLNALGHGLRAEVAAGKGGLRSDFLSPWLYGDLAWGPIVLQGTEWDEDYYRSYVTQVADHPALFGFIPFDDTDLFHVSPNFQRHLRERVRQWAPHARVYVLWTGTFGTDHKVAFEAFDGVAHYHYPIDWHGDVGWLTHQLREWQTLWPRRSDQGWLMLGSGFGLDNGGWPVPPRGGIDQQWEAVHRSAAPVTGFGYFAWDG